jgi:hypothetical protein
VLEHIIIEEGDIATGVNLEEVDDLGAKQCALV